MDCHIILDVRIERIHLTGYDFLDFDDGLHHAVNFIVGITVHLHHHFKLLVVHLPLPPFTFSHDRMAPNPSIPNNTTPSSPMSNTGNCAMSTCTCAAVSRKIRNGCTT